MPTGLSVSPSRVVLAELFPPVGNFILLGTINFIEQPNFSTRDALVVDLSKRKEYITQTPVRSFISLSRGVYGSVSFLG